MTRFTKLPVCVSALLISMSLAIVPGVADAQGDKGKGKSLDKGSDKGQSAERRPEVSRQGERSPRPRADDRRDGHDSRERVILQPRPGVHFADQHRAYIRDYYTDEYRRGFCPPGLAKKENGCMPPGQAKKWDIGRPLPREVIFYDLPPRLSVQIGIPPAGYRYVRVAADILLIAIGTGMVIDAIHDLGRM